MEPAPTNFPEPPAAPIVAPPAPVDPAPPAPAPVSLADGGETQTSVMEKIFGKSSGELGFTGIFIIGLMATAYVYKIMYYRKQIMSAGANAAMQKQIDELKMKLAA